MAKRSKDHDFATVARNVLERTIGARLNGEPLRDEDKGKNKAAIELGKLGGKKGGKARASKLTPARRSEIAKKAARARWEE
jgi:hypothetical protein